MFVRFVSIRSNSKPVWAQHAPRLGEKDKGKEKKSFCSA